MIDTGAGVIDSDYRGTVFVLLFNFSDNDFEGKPNHHARPKSICLSAFSSLCANGMDANSQRRRPYRAAHHREDRGRRHRRRRRKFVPMDLTRRGARTFVADHPFSLFSYLTPHSEFTVPGAGVRCYTRMLPPVQNLDDTDRGAGGFGSTGGHTGL